MGLRYLLTLVILMATVQAAPAADLVPQLRGSGPNGTDTLDYTLYSGYVNHTDSSKMLHYMMVYSQNNWKTDPLIIWFNGGPGCSSMLAFMQEHGPYLMPNGEYNFTKNDYSWNREANMLYIEQPAGVGYSYCDNATDSCIWDDNNVASDNVKTILGWFELFPEFKQHELYISGESYAGIYVPYLVNGIHHHNQQYQRDPNVFKPNLKGMMVGNGVTNWLYDTAPATVDLYYWHSLVSMDWYQNWTMNNCSMSQFAPNQTETCDYLGEVFDNTTNAINVYDILGTCWGAPSGNETNQFQAQPTDVGFSMVGGKMHAFPKAATAAEYTPWIKKGYGEDPTVPPCTFAAGMLEYLNADDVREQLHIPTMVQPWTLCSPIEYDSLQIGSQWIWESLKGKYRMLKFSGDTDGAVPTKGTLRWIDSMNRPVTEDWRPYFVDGELAGSVKEWEGMTLGIIHGAGHMAPQFKPPQTYHLIFNWLKQVPI